jgi:hypothetical protein
LGGDEPLKTQVKTNHPSQSSLSFGDEKATQKVAPAKAHPS